METDHIWNFHNDIASSIEIRARAAFGFDKKGKTIFKPDKLEIGCLVEAMILLLRSRYGYEYNQALMEFETRYGCYLGKRVSVNPKNEEDAIPIEKCKEMYCRFVELYDQTEAEKAETVEAE